jgi:hypothetical protein
MAYHNFSLLMESYALLKSINASPSCFFVFILCWIIVYSISAYSVVVWWARNPAWVGACRFSVWAVVVSRAFIVAMKTFANGGGMAILL